MDKFWARIDRSAGLDDEVHAELVWMLYQSRFGIRWAIVAIDLPLLFLLTHRAGILPSALVALFPIVCACRIALSEVYAGFGRRTQPRPVQRRWEAAYLLVGSSYAGTLAALTSFVIASGDAWLIAWIIGNIVGYAYGIVAYVANRPLIAYAMTHLVLVGTLASFAGYGQEITLWMAVNLVIACLAIGNMIERHYATTLRAIADRRTVESYARTDYLTGLANRRHLGEFFEAMPHAARAASSLLSIDLDRFKAVNDTFGHTAGDAVLKAAAERIRLACGPGAFVARTGGDEFTAIVPGGEVEGQRAARAIHHAFSAPFRVAGGEADVGASVGRVPLLDVDSLDTLNAQADTLMYAEKAAAKSA